MNACMVDRWIQEDQKFKVTFGYHSEFEDNPEYLRVSLKKKKKKSPENKKKKRKRNETKTKFFPQTALFLSHSYRSPDLS